MDLLPFSDTGRTLAAGADASNRLLNEVHQSKLKLELGSSDPSQKSHLTGSEILDFVTRNETELAIAAASVFALGGFSLLRQAAIRNAVLKSMTMESTEIRSSVPLLADHSKDLSELNFKINPSWGLAESSSSDQSLRILRQKFDSSLNLAELRYPQQSLRSWK